MCSSLRMRASAAPLPHRYNSNIATVQRSAVTATAPFVAATSTVHIGGIRMVKNLARLFLTLPLVLLLVGMQSQSAFAKGKTATQKAEDKCVSESAQCLRKCEPPLKGIAVQECRNQCGNHLNGCLQKVKTISVDPATQKQTVKQNPAAAGQTTNSNKGGANKQGMQKSGNKK